MNSSTSQVGSPTIKGHERKSSPDDCKATDRFDWDVEGGDLARRAAWKYIGYPGLSKWMSASNRLTFRKFAELNVRLLLKRQDEIIRMERELKRMDQFSKELPIDQGGCGSLRLDAATPRGRLLDAIDERLREYSQRLNDFLLLQEHPSATSEQVEALQRWLETHPNVIETPEQDFAFRNQEDLLSIKGRSRSSRLAWVQNLAWPAFASYSSVCERSQGTHKAPLSFAVPLAVMLFVPIWTMAFCNCTQRLAVVGLFTFGFCMFVVSRTRLRSSHRCLAIVAYFTILMLALDLTPTITVATREAHPAGITMSSDSASKLGFVPI